MNDRELLEMAAKAAGVDSEWHNEDDADFDAQGCGMWMKGERTPDNNRYWNPLRHDGDALRLAAKLQFDLSLGHGGASVKIWGRRILAEELCHPDSGDDLACARRAITRAAAEIGRIMP